MPRTAPPNQYETAVMGSLPPPPGLYDDDGAPPAPQEEYFLSLDAGTSSIKAAVIEVRNSGERRVVSFSIESLPPPAAVAPPSLGRSSSHLKRPAGLALHDLQVPAVPSGAGSSVADAPPAAPAAAAAGGGGGGEGGEGSSFGGEVGELDVLLAH